MNEAKIAQNVCTSRSDFLPQTGIFKRFFTGTYFELAANITRLVKANSHEQS